MSANPRRVSGPCRSRHLKASALAAALAALLAPLPGIAQDGMAPVPAPAGAARGGALPVVAVFSNLPGAANAQVPGLPGVRFAPGLSNAIFDRPFGSTAGQIVLSALTDLPTAEDEVILRNGVVVAREGTPLVPGGPELVGPIDTRLAVTDAGDFAYATNTDAATAVDEVIVAVLAGQPGVVAREGDPVPAIAGASYGATLSTPVLASDGRVGFLATGLQGVATAQSRALLLGPDVPAQSGITVPAGQLGSEPWENFDLEDFWIDAAGGLWLAQGDLAGDTGSDDVVVVDGAVVVQEGVVLPGSGFAEPVDLNGIIGVSMAPAGRWFVRGNNAGTEVDWVYSDGQVLATLGDPVAGDPGEVWSDAEFGDCFFLHVGDGRGNHVIGGVSNGPTASNGLLVLNASTVLARESDPVDIDGNGQFDDDAFFNTFGNDDGVLTDAGEFHFVATLRDAAGTVIGSGYFVIDTGLGDDVIFADGFETP